MRLRNTQSILLLALSHRQRQPSKAIFKTQIRQKYLFKGKTMSLSSSSTPKCVPCSGLDDSAKLSLEEAKTELVSLGGVWTLEESQDGILSLSRKFTAKNFQSALDAINDIGVIAETESHHPNLHLTNYREVEVEIYTHKLNGLTRNDFILAAKINNEVKIVYSPKWLRENPSAEPTSKT